MPTIEKPAEKTEEAATPAFKDSDEVTVLFGYGKYAPTAQHFIDNYAFVGGIGRNIPYSVAKHWQAGTREDGKPVTSRVRIQAILSNHATEADYIRATGIQKSISDAHLSALVSGLDANALAKMLTPDQAKALAAKLGK